MCTIPPPPPAPVLPNSTQPVKTILITDVKEQIIDSESCQWALEFSELRESCVKNNICVDKPPYRYKYIYFESKLQIGPTCGLVALSMVVSGKISPDELLNIAKLEGFTSNGEMLSCKIMKKLADKIHRLLEINNVRCILKEESLFSAETVERLLNGAVLLVPYDADFNHSPCLKNGHTAHWAIVCGVIIVENNDNSFSDPDNVFVLCKHGKSNYLALWKLSQLAISNNNLWEFSPKKGADGLVYVLPVGGLGGVNGLRGQFLIFEEI